MDWTQPGVQAGAWQLVQDSPVSGRYGHATVVVPNQGSACVSVIYVVGGCNATTYMNDVLWSTDVGRTWTARNLTSDVFSPRAFHSLAASTSGVLVLAGGFSSVYDALSDVWVSLTGGETWLQANSRPGLPSAR